MTLWKSAPKPRERLVPDNLPDAPPELIETLERLGLASAAQVASVSRRAQRLADGLPMFESVWIDALAQARLVTPFQAEHLRGGTADALRCGPLLITDACSVPGLTEVFLARNLESGEIVRLEIARGRQHPEADAELLRETLRKLQNADRRYVHLPSLIGHQGDAVWVAGPQVAGTTAQAWMIRHGRFAPGAVLEIARQMVVALSLLEQAGGIHGDVGASRLVLTPNGQVVLPLPMLRPTLRPAESYATADLPPEAYDGLAPERVADGSPPCVSSELYACGCLWWHLAAGRSPLAGVNATGKLRAAEVARIPDIRAIAPELPPPLAKAITLCLVRDPEQRPQSFTRLASLLGPPTRQGRELLRRGSQAAAPGASILPQTPSWHMPQRSRIWAAAAAGILIATAVVTWPLWKPRAKAEAPVAVAAANSKPAESDSGQSQTPSAIEATANSDSQQSHNAATPSTPPEAIQQDGAQQEVRLLPVDRPLRLLQRLPLQDGQMVRGERNLRAQVIVPPEGLVVDRDDVVFENIDFVWDPESPGLGNQAGAALVRVRAAGVRFRQCSFQTAEATSGGSLPSAILWQRSAGELISHLPTYRMELSDCVFRQVQAAIDVRLDGGAVVLEVHHTLMLGPGPLVYFSQAPRAEDVTQISLSRTTLRGGPLLACRHEQGMSPGEISIETNESVLAGAQGSGLILLAGAESPEPIVRQLHWSGEGSVLQQGCHVGSWLSGQGAQAIDESSFSIDGLVRSELEFADTAEVSTAASQLERCRAPLRSATLPGIGEGLPPFVKPSPSDSRLGS